MKYLLAIAILFGTYKAYMSSKEVGFTGEHHDQVIMYSATWCGECRRRKVEMEKSGLEYEERYIDGGYELAVEYTEKLKSAGLYEKSYGIPVFDVKGHILVNSPPLSKIIEVINSN